MIGPGAAEGGWGRGRRNGRGGWGYQRYRFRRPGGSRPTMGAAAAGYTGGESAGSDWADREGVRDVLRVHRVRGMGRARIALMGIGLVLLIAGLAAPVAAQGMATLAVRQTTQLGRFVTDAQGRTLYEFRRDTGIVSACTDACLTTWPPLVVPTGQPVLAAGVGGTAVVAVQADGRRQVVYNG